MLFILLLMDGRLWVIPPNRSLPLGISTPHCCVIQVWTCLEPLIIPDFDQSSSVVVTLLIKFLNKIIDLLNKQQVHRHEEWRWSSGYLACRMLPFYHSRLFLSWGSAQNILYGFMIYTSPFRVTPALDSVCISAPVVCLLSFHFSHNMPLFMASNALAIFTLM